MHENKLQNAFYYLLYLDMLFWCTYAKPTGPEWITPALPRHLSQKARNIRESSSRLEASSWTSYILPSQPKQSILLDREQLQWRIQFGLVSPWQRVWVLGKKPKPHRLGAVLLTDCSKRRWWRFELRLKYADRLDVIFSLTKYFLSTKQVLQSFWNNILTVPVDLIFAFSVSLGH